MDQLRTRKICFCHSRKPVKLNEQDEGSGWSPLVIADAILYTQATTCIPEKRANRGGMLIDLGTNDAVR